MKRDLGHGYELDDDPARIDVDAVHEFISNHSYWAPGRPRQRQRELVERSVRVVGLYRGGAQVGFARAAGDGALLYLADVYVLPDHRGRGLGVELVREAVEHGPHRDLRWLLHTRDMHPLYRRFGFDVPGERAMERPPAGG